MLTGGMAGARPRVSIGEISLDTAIRQLPRPDSGPHYAVRQPALEGIAAGWPRTWHPALLRDVGRGAAVRPEVTDEAFTWTVAHVRRAFQ